MSTKNITTRNSYLNFLKGIACFGVVYLHTRCPFPIFDGIVQSVFRIPVPLFFMISGYFCFYGDYGKTLKHLPSKVKHILSLNIWGNLYNFAFIMFTGIIGSDSGGIDGIVKKFHEFITWQHLKKWVLWNEDPFVNIMWFLSALLYAYFLFWLIYKLKVVKYIYWSIPILLIFLLGLCNVCSICGVPVEKIYYRNYIFMGFPFFMLGYWLHEKQEKVLKIVTYRNTIIICVVGILIAIVECFFVGRQDIYFGTIIATIAVMCLALHRPNRFQNNILTCIGEKYSLYVYIFHYSIFIILDTIGMRYLNGKISLIFYSLLSVEVFGISILMTACFLKAKNIIMIKKDRWKE